MSHRGIIATIVLCTAAVVLAITWPRFMPRYQEVPGGVVDRWTGDRCSTLLSEIALREDPEVTPLCIFGAGRRSLTFTDGRWGQ